MTQPTLEEIQSGDYDWIEAFALAGDPEGVYNEANISAAVGTATDTSPFTRGDVEEVFYVVEGEHDVSDWVCVGRLKDGRFFALYAGCDYTGWD